MSYYYTDRILIALKYLYTKPLFLWTPMDFTVALIVPGILLIFIGFMAWVGWFLHFSPPNPNDPA